MNHLADCDFADVSYIVSGCDSPGAHSVQQSNRVQSFPGANGVVDARFYAVCQRLPRESGYNKREPR